MALAWPRHSSFKQLSSSLQAAFKQISRISQAAFKQLSSSFQTTFKQLSSSLQTTSKQLSSSFQAAFKQFFQLMHLLRLGAELRVLVELHELEPVRLMPGEST
jgi:hypothetical protein